jgi:hypothetical protein
MAVLTLVLLILALVAFLVGAVLANRARAPWALAVSLGLALWVATAVLGAFPGAG